MTGLSHDRAKQLVKDNWDASGACCSCGWHAALYEYDLDFDMEINVDRQRIELPCLNKDDENSHNHRGVRVYYDHTYAV